MQLSGPANQQFSTSPSTLRDDAAIEAAPERRGRDARTGVDVPDDAFAWLTAQTEGLAMRGVPGLPGVLAQIGVQHPYVAAGPSSTHLGPAPLGPA